MPDFADVESQEYYQGLIAKEDLAGILEAPGDFVVRMECKPGEMSKYVLCVFIHKDNKLDVKEFIINRSGKSFCIGTGAKYDGIVPLIDDLTNKRTQLSKEPGEDDVALKRGVPRPSWELKHCDVLINEGEVLGSGQFGKVCKGELMLTVTTMKRIKVAIKVANKDEDHKSLSDTLKEARAMRNIDHPHCIRFYGIVIERDPVMLVIELVNLGSLLSYLQKQRPVSMDLKALFALHASWGIEYLHTKKVIHRDIAARNCLLNRPEGTDQITLKIADFGLSRVGDMYQVQGKRPLPVRFLPKESIENGIFNSKTDVWMYGALLFEIYSEGKELYKGIKLAQVKERITKGDLQEIPADFPPHAVELINGCWMRDAADRLTMKQVATTLEKLTSKVAPVVCDPAMLRNQKKKKKDSAERTEGTREEPSGDLPMTPTSNMVKTKKPISKGKRRKR